MTLYEKIIQIYPELADIEDKNNPFSNMLIMLQNDGNGDYIAKWDHPTLPRPTEEELS